MTKFEQVANILNHSDAPDLRENCIYWLDGDKYATVNVGGNSRYATRIRKLAEEKPDDVHIYSDKKGGYLLASVPVRAVKLNIVTREAREYTEEELEVLRERMRKMQEARRDSQTLNA